MIRFAEAAIQVMGKAGAHQVEGARRPLGHAYGGGSQYFSMWLVGRTSLRIDDSVVRPAISASQWGRTNLRIDDSVCPPHDLGITVGADKPSH